MTYIFTWLLAVSALSLSFFIGRRVLALRRGDNTFHLAEPSLHVFVKPTIDYSAFQLVNFTKLLIRRLIIYGLTLIGRLLSFLKYGLTRIERRFAGLINSVRGQGTINRERGSVSLFLRQIDETRDRD
jgi:hypothetical protein